MKVRMSNMECQISDGKFQISNFKRQMVVESEEKKRIGLLGSSGSSGSGKGMTPSRAKHHGPLLCILHVYNMYSLTTLPGRILVFHINDLCTTMIKPAYN